MITGEQFPTELATNKDLNVYRKYLEAKAAEPSSHLSSFILPAVGLGTATAFAAKMAGKPNPASYFGLGAAAPILGGIGLIKLDNRIIEKAKVLKDYDDQALAAYLEKDLRIRAARPKQLKQVDRAIETFSKVAAATPKKSKPLLKLLKYVGIPLAIGGAGIYAATKLQPERWEPKDPLVEYSRKPQIILR